LREAKDWRALATTLVLHAAATETDPARRSRAADLSMQAHELFLERVGDSESATHAIVRAVMLRPDNERALARLQKLYATQKSHRELVTLLRWRLRNHGGTAEHHLQLAHLLERHFFAIGEAVKHLELALEQSPTSFEAADRLVALYGRAGAWEPARAVLDRIIANLHPERDRFRLADMHRRAAALSAYGFADVPSAARHLQTSLQLVADDVDSLQAFGVLYLTSGKGEGGGVVKATDILFKAAEAARRQDDRPRALKLLRRCLALRPDHPRAFESAEKVLIAAEDWLALDRLYVDWQAVDLGPNRLAVMLRRAELLETQLLRREEARALYEQARLYQRPGDVAWRRLAAIYTERENLRALVALIEAEVEQAPSDVPSETLLRAATIYREELGLEERAAVYYYKVLEREPFNPVAFEGYKEHWRRSRNWLQLRDLLLYQVEQAEACPTDTTPLASPAFAEEFVELADLCERRLGDMDNAVAVWQRMAKTYPTDPRPATNVTRIQKRARMWDSMARVHETELQQTQEPGRRLDILKRLTQLYRDRQNNPQRAIELYHEILGHTPDDLQARRALSSLYDRAGDYARAVELLKQQFEDSQSTTERVSLLRRMAELWHQELESPDQAIWACREILALAPGDQDAHALLRQILEEQQRWSALYDLLQGELDRATKVPVRTRRLQQLADLAEFQLGDPARAMSDLARLASLREDDLEVLDRRIALLERVGNFETLASLLQASAASPATPPIRRKDLQLRLGRIAEYPLRNLELARTSFEAVMATEPLHLEALTALARIHEQEGQWQAKAAVLAKLQELAITEDETFELARERARIFAEPLNDPTEAAKCIAETFETPVPRSIEVARLLLDYYVRAGAHRQIIRQAEIVLLAEPDPAQRRSLYDLIRRTWSEPLENQNAALEAFARYADEAPNDLEALSTLSDLQLSAGDGTGALLTLQRRLDATESLEIRIETLERMAEICERNLQRPEIGIEYLRQALQLSPTTEALVERAREVARRHQQWVPFLRVLAERDLACETSGDAAGQIAVCIEASRIAEDHLDDGESAFGWLRRAYFIALALQQGIEPLRERLEATAARHGLWGPLVALIEEEVDFTLAQSGDHRGSIVRLLTAADLAEARLHEGQRVIELLERAHSLDPRDEGVAHRLERAAERYEAWPALIKLEEGRLRRASEVQGRFDACMAIAGIHEHKLSAYERAFQWIERAHREVKTLEPRLAERAFDRLVALSTRHVLWKELASYHMRRAAEASHEVDPSVEHEALREAAHILDERLGDPLSALRILTAGEHCGEPFLDEVRRLCGKLDASRPASGPPLGPLVHLQVLKRLLGMETDPAKRILWLRERSQIREQRWGDGEGAAVECLRVLRLDPHDEDATRELHRLAGRYGQWPLAVLPIAWSLAEGHAEPATALGRLADLYEGALERPEYALRARLAGWARAGDLPSRTEALDDRHSAIWRLAKAVGVYDKPPIPFDLALLPTWTLPEERDLRAWGELGLEPELIGTLPRPPAEPATPMSSDAIEELIEFDVAADDAASSVIQEIPSGELMSWNDGRTAPHGLLLEELDADVVEVMPDESWVEEDRRLTTRRPPPLPRATSEGLPVLPALRHPVLSPRPKVASGWEEVALAYASVPVKTKADRADVDLCLARLWEEGGADLDRAFRAIEDALMTVPEYPSAVAALESLAERHSAVDRLVRAYEALLAEATMPDHLIALGLRLAPRYEDRGDLEAAEERYRGVLQFVPNHLEALRALCRIYEPTTRFSDFAAAYGSLLEAERGELSHDELVLRTMRLAALLADRLNRPTEAIERLTLLARNVPGRVEVHRALIDLLVASKKWPQAIEAMRVATETTEDLDFRLDNVGRAAEIYERELGLHDRAIAAWREILADRPNDERALTRLTALYEAKGTFEELLPILDRRLALPIADVQQRIALRVVKARVLEERPGQAAAAIQALEALRREAPDNDEVAMRLSQAYRKAGRRDEGLTLLRSHLEHKATTDLDAYRNLALTVARVLDEDMGEPTLALAEIERALGQAPADRSLLDRKVALCRRIGDTTGLAVALAHLGSIDGWLEAAQILRGTDGDGTAALQLYTRALERARKEPDDAESGHRVARALEGILRIHLRDGDTRRATAFIDEQLKLSASATSRAQLLTELGRITFHHTRDAQTARRHFDAALGEEPGYAPAKLGKAEVLVAGGQSQEAEQLLVEAVDALGLAREHENELVAALLALAKILQDTGRSGEAYRRLASAARHAPDNLEIRAAIVRNRIAAGRLRDAMTSADQVQRQLEQGLELSPRNRRLASDIFVGAAEAEAHHGSADASFERYRRALELDPSNPSALAPLVTLCKQRGEWLGAAQHAIALATIDGQPPEQQGPRYLAASVLFHEAAQAQATESSTEPGEDSGQPPAAVRQLTERSLAALERGLDLLERADRVELELEQVRTGFQIALSAKVPAALRLLDALVRSRSREPEQLPLLLAGLDVALDTGDPERAGHYAKAARSLAPSSSAAVLGQARVLEALGKIDDIEAIVQTYLATRSRPTDPAELQARIELLTRLAELQKDRPRKALAALRAAADLAPNALGLAQRQRLAELYGQVNDQGPAVLDNHAALLQHDPLYEPSLAALAKHCAAVGDTERALALHAVRSLIAPRDEATKTALAELRVQDGRHAVLDPLTFDPELPDEAGVGEALLAMWEKGAPLLAERWPRVEVSPEARISPLGDAPLAKAWNDALKRLGNQSKVSLVDATRLDPSPELSSRTLGAAFAEAKARGTLFSVLCQNPPLIVAHPAALASDELGELRFALGRACGLTDPRSLMAVALPAAELSVLISALLAAFHPRHGRRKQHLRPDEPALELANELARKLPIRVSRQLGQIFKTRENGAFDSLRWRSAIRRRADRFGLVWSGDLRAAIRVLAPDAASPQLLRQRVEQDADLRAFLAYAIGSDYASARRTLGSKVTSIKAS